MLTVAIPKRNKLQNIIVLTPKDGGKRRGCGRADRVRPCKRRLKGGNAEGSAQESV